MAAKPELVAPTETDAFAVLKTADTPVASINIDGDYKALNRYECPTDPKIVDKIPSLSQKDHGKLEKLDSLVSKVDVLAHDVEILKIRTTPNQDKHTESLNSISLQINENERMMALLKARWAREAEEARIAEMIMKTVKVYTIQTTKEDPPSLFKDDEIDFDNFNLTEVIKFLQIGRAHV